MLLPLMSHIVPSVGISQKQAMPSLERAYACSFASLHVLQTNDVPKSILDPTILMLMLEL